MIRKSSVTVFLCMLFVSGAAVTTGTARARSINDAIGKTSFTWLKSVADAGISATGDCLGARDGASGLLVHPAAVAGITGGTAKMSYVAHYVDTQYGSVGYAGKFRDRSIGIRLTYVNYGEFARTNKLGERTGTFTAGDMGFTVNLGKQVREDLKIGAAASFLTSRLEDFTAQAVTADMGIIYYPPFEGLTVGAALTNLGKVTKSYSSGYSEALPVTLTIGARKKLVHSPFTIMADVIFPNDNDITYALGVEASILDRLFLYAGTKSRNDIDVEAARAETDYAGFTTFGLGIVLDRYRFNYAFCPDDVLNEDVHKVTLGVTVR